MSRKIRKFFTDVENHCYQKTAGGEVLFYNVSDYLVMYTAFCVAARRHDVKVLSLVLMPDHLHHCTKTGAVEELASFVQDYTSHFAQENNRVCHHKGDLFLKPFGSAPKVGDKNVRSTLIYLGNNGSERKLALQAEHYRWCFLAYYRNPNPFSEPLRLSAASKPLRRAISLVKDRCRRNHAIHYQTLQWMFKPLCDRERKQLTDFIITQYNVIDYEAAVAYFNGYDEMLQAMHFTKGSEHDIQEEFVGWSDKVYNQLYRALMEMKGLDDIHDFLKTPAAERRKWIPVLRDCTEATLKQVKKYLRVPLEDE